MEAPPPGYNPNVSLLSGGTGTILPVQGGGGSGLPMSYNANESLLEGGTGTIQAIRGGGEAKKKSGVSFAGKNIVQELKTLPLETSGVETLEIYSIPTKEQPLPKSFETKEERRKAVEVYSQEKLTKVFLETPILYVDYKICKKKGFDFSSVAKKISLHSIEDPIVLVISNLKGDLQRFLRVKQYVEEKQFFKHPKQKQKNHFVVFAGEFLSDSAESNTVLLDEYIRFANEHENVHCLFSKNENLKTQMCSYMETYYEKPTLQKTSKNIPFLHEADVLVFPSIKTILTCDGLPGNLGKTLKESNPPESFYLPPLKGEKQYTLESYFVAAFNATLPKSELPDDAKVSVDCPPEKYSCPEFITGFPIAALPNPLSIIDKDIYLFYKNQNQLHLPFFRDADKNTGAEELPAPAPVPAEPKPAPSPGGFQSSPNAKEASSLFKFPVELHTFQIRVPTAEVKKDWKELVFTESEVDFFKHLHLTPSLLEKVFQEDWKNKLVGFLESLVYSKCFNDTTLLMNVECMNAREFLRAVHLQLYNTTLESMYERWGSQTPHADKQNILGGILERIKQKNLIGKVPTGKLDSILQALKEKSLQGEPQTIDEKNFRGDPEGRYLDFHVDTQDKTLPYFINYVEKESNATGREKKYYKRLYGKDPESILEKYKTLKMGPPEPVPAPPGPPAPGPPAPAPPGPPAPPAPAPPGPPAPALPKLSTKTFKNFKKNSERLSHLESLLAEVEKEMQPPTTAPSKSISQRIKNGLSKIKLPGTKKGGRHTKYRLTRKRFLHKV
jgi:hypothetical protein